MKRAKKKLIPILRRLDASTRRTKRPMTKAIAAVDASNKRLSRKPRYSLDELLAQCDPTVPLPRVEGWDEMKPVGKELPSKEPTLDEMLAAFDPNRHGGEVMAAELGPKIAAGMRRRKPKPGVETASEGLRAIREGR